MHFTLPQILKPWGKLKYFILFSVRLKDGTELHEDVDTAFMERRKYD